MTAKRLRVVSWFGLLFVLLTLSSVQRLVECKNSLEPMIRKLQQREEQYKITALTMSKSNKLSDKILRGIKQIGEKLIYLHPAESSSLYTSSLPASYANLANIQTKNQKKNSDTSSSSSKPKNVKFQLFSKRSLPTKKNSLANLISFMKGGCNDKKKVLILMSDTGGGHRASAQALDQALNEQFPEKFDVEIMDIWTDHANWPYNKFVPVYRYLAKHPILWRGFYAYGSFPVTKKLTEIASWRSSFENFRRAIEASDPDFVVSVHPLTQMMPLSIVENMNKRRAIAGRDPIPFVTVVTDLGGAHRCWFDNRVDACYVPSEAVRKLALKGGIDEEKIIMKGLPIRPSFWKASKPKLAIRKQLGLPTEGKTVLLMGGGDGVGGLGTIASEVANKLNNLPFASQLIVICGHNKKILQALQDKLHPTKNLNVVVKGFVNNIDEFMSASDCLVTKAGPGTIAESMVRGLPMVISSFLPGQEAGNVPFVVNGGFGIYTGNRPKKIADTVSTLFSNEARLSEMSIKAKLSSHPEATVSIARDIGESLVHLMK
eukprot:CAMPEP_0173152620 /NCGR_PEP_ID=MMETSP1105-20130129/12350_1 /TAXON_ID=2985 /ORGANISM="Ochromonas sp., Strain BG-1" /LENGTH=544 /DNA_ID=CAMNT_0014068353 /DNA_START=210 /DNA_END=1844 /DNA_ORIENTATION=-